LTCLLTRDIEILQRGFRIAEDGPEVTRQLLELAQTILMGGKQIHDANIVATMLVYSVPRLLTNNPKDFVRFQPLITVLPL